MYDARPFHLADDFFHRILTNARHQIWLSDIALVRSRRLPERPVEAELVFLRRRVAELEGQLQEKKDAHT